MDCTIYVAKTKALISFAVTVKLICVFVFAYAKSRFSHDEAHLALSHFAVTLCLRSSLEGKTIFITYTKINLLDMSRLQLIFICFNHQVFLQLYM